METEVRKLVCRLTEAEKAAYRSEVADLGIALEEILEATKAKAAEIKAAKARQSGVLNTLKFGLEESDDRDGLGRTVLLAIDANQRIALEDENIEIASELEWLEEERYEAKEQQKAIKKTLAERLKALKFGQEERPVKCEWHPDFADGKSLLYRLDTGESIDSRPLTDEESQQAFQFKKTEASSARAMVRCSVCTVAVGATGGMLDEHQIGSSVCSGSGLTTQQAAALGGVLAEQPTLPDSPILAALREAVASTAYGVGREGIRTAEDVAEEREKQEELEELGADWDASAALPGYMAELGIPSIADLRPSHIDALIQLAAGHAPDLIAYLLAQPEGLKPTVKRALRAI